ncbi:MAG: DNA topoisomerase I [Candidatus Solincola sediminis]|uniref:DNA topoisomerase 1 n=1 Tax=Candidatus Solincola sediminis TaxID=1797199 RepID=A0A1F2WQ45_9ACTN|nr:MAG: DNA topoisomerase I [Candidatus Solincola sediminis]OFW58961.1 MAG: DNA topoisomerase I [Candidatus Solincola sediminis]
MRGMKLIITEKNTTAKRISSILSDDKARALSKSTNPVYAFKMDGEEVHCLGLKGHILKVDFPDAYQQWQDVEPRELIHADIIKIPTNKALIKAMQTEAKQADEVIIATDFDREGELIGVDAINQVKQVRPEIPVKRARFSALTPVEIKRVFAHLEEPYYDLASAGEARQDIDLIWGASLTRFISLASTRLGKYFLSAGRVQSPTLALIVDREKERKAFVPTPFWTLKINCIKEGETFQAVHAKERFLVEKEARDAFSHLQDTALMREVKITERSVRPPIPFNTTGFLTTAASLGFSAARAMSVAENLYMNGYISYPRTDNTVYPASLELREILQEVSKSPDFAQSCAMLLKQDKLTPTRGKKETTDHPPIHPTAAAFRGKLSNQEWRIYELVVRRFMATLAPAAVVQSIRADLDCGPEPFIARGNRIAFEGWYRHYPYGVKKEVILPALETGDVVAVEDPPELKESETQPPARYGQGKLIEKMEELGLGTKSTRHSIIESLYQRGYIYGDPIVPTETGISVTEALRKFAGVISSPEMTAQLENDMDAIAEGKETQLQVLGKSRDILSEVMNHLETSKEEVAAEIRNGIKGDRILGACPSCGSNLRMVKAKKSKKRFVGCSNYPECTTTYPLPQTGTVTPTGEVCQDCGSPKVRVLNKGRKPWTFCLDPDCPTKKKTGDASG